MDALLIFVILLSRKFLALDDKISSHAHRDHSDENPELGSDTEDIGENVGEDEAYRFPQTVVAERRFFVLGKNYAVES